MTKKEMINELMEGNTYAHPQMVEQKLNRKSKSIIEFYFNTQYRTDVEKKYVIDNIIRIG